MHPPTKNALLAALPAADYHRLLPHLEPVFLPLGWSVYEAGGKMDHVFFVTEGIVSLLYVMENGASAEIAITGSEGLIGISLFMGGESTPSSGRAKRRSGLQVAGKAAQAGIRARRRAAAPAAALHPGADYTDGADRSMQPPPYRRAATVPLAAAEHRPPAHQ